MSAFSYSITGMDKVLAKIKTLSDAPKLFDRDFQRAAQRGVRYLVEGTGKRTGNTRRGWTTPRKLGLSDYQVANSLRTADKRWSIVRILDEGRREVTAKSGKKLYIPLSTRGMAKRLGQPIPKGFIHGEDYVLANKSKRVEGTKFIKKSNDRVGKELSKDMSDTIQRTANG